MNHLDLDLENSCGSIFRSRANTWPLPRPEITETFISTSSDIPEEKTDSSANVNLCGVPVLGLSGSNNNLSLNSNNNNEQTVIPTTAHDASLEHVGSNGSNGSSGNQSGGGATAKKNSSRRNAWGNMSYADLITQAIQSSPDNRLTLSQIYDWMVQNVLYFKDKGDSNSSAGWKNSIRHNLSLHNRFMRVQNEGTGKSSWWMINPDAKPGKANRRRAQSMETQKYEKKRGRVKKKVEALRNGIALDTTPSPSSSVSEGLDMFPDSPIHHFQLSPDFRPRASSNASSCGHLSPIPAVETDMHDNQVPPLSPLHAWKPDLVRWVSDAQDQLTTEKIVEMANTMKLGGNAYVKNSPIGESLSPNQANVTLGSNSYTTLNSYNTTAMSPYNSGAGTGTLHRNGSDPYFQNPGCIENNITLTSLNSVPSSRTPAKLLSGENVGSNFGQLSNLSPSISPTQSMDIVSNNAHNSINSNFHTPKHNVSAHQTQATVQSGGGTYSPNGIENHLIMCANLNSKNLMSSSSNLTSLTSLGTTATQVMGHLLSLNNSLPNDLDFDSLQGGLECDVDQVISHELSVDGNLDFNFDNLHNTSVAPTSVSTSAASHSWVR